MRYLLFGGSCYYPSGGMNDLITKSNDRSLLVKIVEQLTEEDENGIGEIDWYQIYDQETEKIIIKSKHQPNWE